MYKKSKKKNPIKKALKLPQQVLLWPVLKAIETPWIRNGKQPQFPPVFMISPPRSGSTLAYQVFCRGLKVSYFSNFMMRFATSPVLAGRIAKPLGGGNPPDRFTSWYGYGQGWSAPHQGVEAWERWFGHGIRYMGEDGLSDRAMREMAGTVSAIESLYECPFLNKWQGHAVHILPLVKTFPKALFVRILRDPVQVAQSLLRSRWELRGDPNRWTSAMPKEYETIKDKSYIEQVCEQVYCLEKNMDEDSRRVGPERFMTVEYEALCKDPRGILENFRRFYRERSGGFEPEKRNAIPDSFPCSRSTKVSEEDLLAIQACISGLFSRRSE